MTGSGTGPLPSPEDLEVVVPAPGAGPGNWAGAASGVLVDGEFWLVYRVRRPVDSGRGVNVVIARSGDGVHFSTVAEVGRGSLGAESLERPALVPMPGGGWRLYLSCATPGSKHWWVDSLTANSPADLPSGDRRLVLPGSSEVAVKDPVILVRDGEWQMWVCCHPLDDPGHEDRMSTRYLVSADGLRWDDRGQVLTGSPGHWDARGARVTAVLGADPLVVLYDGRPDAQANWHETTGVARWDGSRLLADPAVLPIASPHSDRAFRYACLVHLPDGRTRFYVESARPDGAHDLVSCLR